MPRREQAEEAVVPVDIIRFVQETRDESFVFGGLRGFPDSDVDITEVESALSDPEQDYLYSIS